MTKLEALIKQFEKALGRFREVMGIPKTDVVRDSAIQRFEFTMDLSWKMLKAFLEDKKGVICVSPKECFREAYRHGVIEYDDDWIKLVDIRNETAHTYNEEMAEEVYAQLQNALEHFDILFKKIKDLI
jgi:nucleotidyltransferase substrate binding protein (TIGR01987 family)